LVTGEEIAEDRCFVSIAPSLVAAAICDVMGTPTEPSPLKSRLKMVSKFFQRGAVTGEVITDVSDEVALAVEAPDREGLAADHLPSEIVASAYLYRTDGYVGAGCDGDSTLLDLGAERTAASHVKKVVVAGLNQRRVAVERYGRRGRWWWRPDVSVASEVLAKMISRNYKNSLFFNDTSMFTP